MKVGILSMQRVQNYGSFLQAYALKRMLESLGHQVCFVDLEAAARREQSCPLRAMLWKLRRIDRYVFKRLLFRQKRRTFRRRMAAAQREWLGLSAYPATAEGCDAVVIGSDEIFACDSKGPWKITSARFGNFPGVKRAISYAASCGSTSLADTAAADRPLLARGLRRLDAVSLRDEATARLVRSFRRDDFFFHLDPVLLYDFSPELSLGETMGVPQTPYLLVYSYQDRIQSADEISAIRSYARAHGLKTISLGGSQCWCDEYAPLSPFQVLAYFRHAACVVTDTFHGTVLAVKYGRPFAVLVRPGNAQKLGDLIWRLALEEHRLDHPADLPSILDAGWEAKTAAACRELLEREKRRTAAYLAENLGQESPAGKREEV